MHFGPGDATTVKELRVRFPDGSVTRLRESRRRSDHRGRPLETAGLDLAPPDDRVEGDGEEEDQAGHDPDGPRWNSR